MDSVEVGTKQEMYELGALNLSPTLSYEEWENVGKALATMDGNIEWWIGDYFVFGEAAYGEKWAQATAKFGRPESTLQGYMYVASRFPQTLRRRNLPWWAHREVAALGVVHCIGVCHRVRMTSVGVHAVSAERGHLNLVPVRRH